MCWFHNRCLSRRWPVWLADSRAIGSAFSPPKHLYTKVNSLISTAAPNFAFQCHFRRELAIVRALLSAISTLPNPWSFSGPISAVFPPILPQPPAIYSTMNPSSTMPPSPSLPSRWQVSELCWVETSAFLFRIKDSSLCRTVHYHLLLITTSFDVRQ